MRLCTRVVMCAFITAGLVGPVPHGRAQEGSIVALGPCTPTDCTVPPPNADFIAVATGNYHTMGLKADGRIVTWGTCDDSQCNVPSPNAGFTAIAAGDSFSLAIRQDGSVAAFGNNEYGQLYVPAPNANFVAVAAGLLHSLGLKSDGSIVAWGANSSGECNVPEPNTGFVAIAGGFFHSLGLKSDGSIVKWGCNGPCPVPEPNTGFTAVAGGYLHNLALRSNGSIVAWGSNNDFGQLNVPEPNTGFVAVAAGDTFSLGLKSDGSIVAWGQFNQGGVPSPNAGYLAVSANKGVAHALRAEVTFIERLPISTNANLVAGVADADVDGDGDTDVLSAEYGNDSIAWYENDGANPPSWTKHDVGYAQGPITVAAADFDRDGDADVISANFNNEGIAWYENNGASPPGWTKRVISGYWVGAWGVHTADLDGDGDVDGIGGLQQTKCGPPLLCPGVEWYENDGGAPPSFTPHPVTPDRIGSSSVQAADVDGDGDTDILSVDTGNDRVFWFENSPGAPGPVWTQRLITNAVDDPWSVFPADLDGDGDVDVLSASAEDDRVAWHENDGASPPSWTMNTITTTADGAISVRAADLDGDGDVDVISGNWSTTPLAWHENDGGSPPSFTEHPIGVCAGAEGMFAARVDGDTDIDIVCGANPPNKIHYFENQCSCGGPQCDNNGDCTDGLFCNGAETCSGGQCQASGSPCAAPLLCRESDDQCVQCLSNANCDDGLFCNGAETCSATGTCQSGGDPCPGQGCDETNNVCTGGPEVWLSFIDSASVPGVGTVQNEDIVARNVTTGAWSIIFDGSDVGLGGLVIDGMARMANGDVLLSFTASGSISGMSGGPNGANLDDSDIVRFIPTSLGANTAGSFAFYFDGSDVGLTTDNEDIDAIALTTTGQLVISTVGSVSATGASGQDADLLLFNATNLGSVTAGSFSMYFDGSDVGLSDNGNEDVDAAGIRTNGAILLSTLGNFSVPAVSGADEDVIQFTPTALGQTTSGTHALYLDLSALGIATAEDVGSVEYKE